MVCSTQSPAFLDPPRICRTKDALSATDPEQTLHLHPVTVRDLNAYEGLSDAPTSAFFELLMLWGQGHLSWRSWASTQCPVPPTAPFDSLALNLRILCWLCTTSNSYSKTPSGASLFFFFNLFLFGCALSLLPLYRLFSSCNERGLLSSWHELTSHCRGFSCYETGALGHSGFSNHGAQA